MPWEEQLTHDQSVLTEYFALKSSGTCGRGRLSPSLRLYDSLYRFVMCFDCLQIFPPFSSSANVGAKKALSKLSRPNSPAHQNTEEDYAYGPPLKHDLNQEDLPSLIGDHDDKKRTSQIDDGDSAYQEDTISDNSMDPATGKGLYV